MERKELERKVIEMVAAAYGRSADELTVSTSSMQLLLRKSASSRHPDLR